MPDFGPVTYGKSKFSKRLIIFTLHSDPSKVYHFEKQATHKETAYWRCVECQKVKAPGQKAPTVRVLADSFLDDPENPRHPHFCGLINCAKSIAQQIDRDTREGIRETGRRPKRAWDEAHARIAETFSDNPELREEVEENYPHYKKCKSGYYRNLNAKIPVINSIAEIPLDLKRTFLGSTSKKLTDPHFREEYLIHQQSSPPMLVFSSPQDLKVLHQSDRVVADGTFTYLPREYFSQLYTIHAFINGQATPVVYALLPDKSTDTYVLLLNIIRSNLEQRFGSVGSMSTFHLDFESAAIRAVKTVFPWCHISGCIFHFSKAVQNWIDTHGLKQVYAQAAPYDLPQFKPFRPWVRRIIALSCLPPDFVKWTWDSFLKNPPITHDPVVDAHIAEFVKYVEGQWLKSADQILLFNHYHNTVPRTTNHAEGYHRGLAFKFEAEFPRLAVFLVEFQKIHHAFNVDQRSMLKKPHVILHPRAPESVQADVDLHQEKMAFYNWRADPAYPTYSLPKIIEDVNGYLGRCGHLIGIH